MKCNYKRALEKEKTKDFRTDYEKFIYDYTKECYYDNKANTLRPDFFDMFNEYISKENQTRLEYNSEKFITFEMTGKQTAILVDEGVQEMSATLTTPDDFMRQFAKMEALNFENGLAQIKRFFGE